MASVAGPMNPSVLPASLAPAKEIPSTFFESFKGWWATGEKESAAAEERLLRRLPYFVSSDDAQGQAQASGPVTATITRVPLDLPSASPSSPSTSPASAVSSSSNHSNHSNSHHHLHKHSNRYINTLSILPSSTQNSNPAIPPTVLLHGYGAGLGFYFQNLPALGSWAARRGARVYALDWLGMGRSARVPFRIRAKKGDVDGRVSEAESFFVESLEEWRVKMGLEEMTLVGHSLGAYFSTVYALRYPTRVRKLILLSPAGIPHDPDTSTPSREADPTPHPASSTGANTPAVPATEQKVEEVKKDQDKARRQQSTFRRIAMYLWEEGYSPFQVVRSALFWGPMLVGKYSSRRFSGLTEEETRDMHHYILNITVAKGSSEYCISHILAPGAFARRPLVDRISPLKIPVTFVYGDYDWMDPEGGSQSVRNLRKAGNKNAKMYIIPNSGHHVYLDNPRAVNDLLVRELDRVTDA